jgi:hypothetical protein
MNNAEYIPMIIFAFVVLGIIIIIKLLINRYSNSVSSPKSFDTATFQDERDVDQPPLSNLFECKDCGKEISKKASSCPNCGAPTTYGKKQEKKKERKQKEQRSSKRSNRQGCGCLLIVLAVVLGLSLIGAPLAGLIFIIGVVVLVVGFLS